MNKRLADMLEYWRTWNAPRRPEIKEGAGDGAARELAQLATAEIASLRSSLQKYGKHAYNCMAITHRAGQYWVCNCGLNDALQSPPAGERQP